MSTGSRCDTDRRFSSRQWLSPLRPVATPIADSLYRIPIYLMGKMCQAPMR